MSEVDIIIKFVIDNNPDTIKFQVTPNDKIRIAECIGKKEFDTMMYLYGHGFLLEVLSYFEGIEEYEQCMAIKESIRNHNKRNKDNLNYHT